MPAKGDHEARPAGRLAGGVARARDRGFGGLTLRAVAAEMGVSTGLLTHYFPSKKALVRHALGGGARVLRPGRDAESRAKGWPRSRTALLECVADDAQGWR